jgi:hydrogenase nickel incorporation protein HypA/HybF
MHEYGMCDGIVDAVQRRAAGKRVARVKVRIGVMHRIVEEVFQQAFAHAALGSEAENAAVDIVAVPVRVVCRSCEAKFDALDFVAVCASCNGVNLDLSGGDELILESIQYDAATDEDEQGETACASESPDKS